MPSGGRRLRERPMGAVELLCVLVVLVALAGLVAWIVTHAAGGTFFQGLV